jgi:hypothetical protein
MGEGTSDERIMLVYEEAVRGWSLQSTVLDELRTRTGILLSAASIASALLGSADLTKHQGFTTWTYFALGTFCLTLLLCVYVLWPTGGWTFVHSPNGLLTEYVTGTTPKSLDDMRKEMAKDTDRYWGENEKKIACQFSAFRWAALTLGVSIVLWIIDLN